MTLLRLLQDGAGRADHGPGALGSSGDIDLHPTPCQGRFEGGGQVRQRGGLQPAQQLPHVGPIVDRDLHRQVRFVGGSPQQGRGARKVSGLAKLTAA